MELKDAINVQQYQDKIALVTGASSGIGAEIACELARRGAHVIVVARRADRLQQVADRAADAAGRITPHVCDVSDEQQVKSLISEIRSAHQRLDLLVNNAGKELVAPLQATRSTAAAELMQINVLAMSAVTRACLRLLVDGSAIVNMASVAALRGAPGMSLYAASKGAVVSFTQALALELATRKVRVNAVAPGIVQTEMTERMFSKYEPGYVERLKAAYPLGFGHPRDVARAVAFLGSDEASWITGQTLVVDGGNSV